jgi:hypothetical protein
LNPRIFKGGSFVSRFSGDFDCCIEVVGFKIRFSVSVDTIELNKEVGPYSSNEIELKGWVHGCFGHG